MTVLGEIYQDGNYNSQALILLQAPRHLEPGWDKSRSHGARPARHYQSFAPHCL